MPVVTMLVDAMPETSAPPTPKAIELQRQRQLETVCRIRQALVNVRSIESHKG